MWQCFGKGEQGWSPPGGLRTAADHIIPPQSKVALLWAPQRCLTSLGQGVLAVLYAIPVFCYPFSYHCCYILGRHGSTVHDGACSAPSTTSMLLTWPAHPFQQNTRWLSCVGSTGSALPHGFGHLHSHEDTITCTPVQKFGLAVA